MRLIFIIKKRIKYFYFLFIFLFSLLFQSNSQIINALSMDNFNNDLITEQLRLKVPSELKQVWIKAEKKVWEPWLSSQDGFLDRQIFWDKEKEEALILVYWKNKKLWKSIPIQEVNEIQNKFDENVKKSLNINENPFKLIYEGELFKQG